MQIVMMRSEFGSPDGIKVFRFPEGEMHDVDTWPMSRELARSFVQAGVAKLVKQQDVPAPTENKDDAGFVAQTTKKEDLPIDESDVDETDSETGTQPAAPKRGRKASEVK